MTFEELRGSNNLNHGSGTFNIYTLSFKSVPGFDFDEREVIWKFNNQGTYRYKNGAIEYLLQAFG